MLKVKKVDPLKVEQSITNEAKTIKKEETQKEKELVEE